jgi:hypothetical protein
VTLVTAVLAPHIRLGEISPLLLAYSFALDDTAEPRYQGLLHAGDLGG